MNNEIEFKAFFILFYFLFCDLLRDWASLLHFVIVSIWRIPDYLFSVITVSFLIKKSHFRYSDICQISHLPGYNCIFGSEC